MEEELSIATISVHLSSDDGSYVSSVLSDDSSLNDEGYVHKKDPESEGRGNAQHPTRSLRSSIQYDLRTASERIGEPCLPARYETSWNEKRDTAIHPYQRRKNPKKLPKRPLSPYSIYFQSQRIIIQAEAKMMGFPRRLGFEDCEEIIGEQWESLGKKERLIYKRLAEDDTLRYRQEMKAYNQWKLSVHRETKEAEDTPSSVEENEAHPANFAGERLYAGKRTAANLFPLSPPKKPFSLAKDNSASMMGGSRSSLHSHLLKDSANMEPIPVLQSQPSNISRLMLQSLLVDTHTIPSILSLPSEAVPTLQPSPSSNGRFALRPGMEVTLSDSRGKYRKYSVEYKCYSVPIAEALKFGLSRNGVVRSDLSSKAHAGTTECPDNQEIEL